MKNLTHDQVKALYLDYRQKAKDITMLGPILPANLSVSDYANVQLCEDGAFVEVHLWVPKGEA